MNLGESINGPANEHGAFVAPDGSYMILTSSGGRPGPQDHVRPVRLRENISGLANQAVDEDLANQRIHELCSAGRAVTDAYGATDNGIGRGP